MTPSSRPLSRIPTSRPIAVQRKQRAATATLDTRRADGRVGISVKRPDIRDAVAEKGEIGHGHTEVHLLLNPFHPRLGAGVLAAALALTGCGGRERGGTGGGPRAGGVAAAVPLG